jgi:hypothetical protein
VEGCILLSQIKIKFENWVGDYLLILQIQKNLKKNFFPSTEQSEVRSFVRLKVFTVLSLVSQKYQMGQPP